MEALDNTETLRTLRSELDGGYVGESYIVTCLSYLMPVLRHGTEGSWRRLFRRAVERLGPAVSALASSAGTGRRRSNRPRDAASGRGAGSQAPGAAASRSRFALEA